MNINSTGRSVTPEPEAHESINFVAPNTPPRTPTKSSRLLERLGPLSPPRKRSCMDFPKRMMNNASDQNRLLPEQSAATRLFIASKSNDDKEIESILSEPNGISSDQLAVSLGSAVVHGHIKVVEIIMDKAGERISNEALANDLMCAKEYDESHRSEGSHIGQDMSSIIIEGSQGRVLDFLAMSK